MKFLVLALLLLCGWARPGSAQSTIFVSTARLSSGNVGGRSGLDATCRASAPACPGRLFAVVGPLSGEQAIESRTVPGTSATFGDLPVDSAAGRVAASYTDFLTYKELFYPPGGGDPYYVPKSKLIQPLVSGVGGQFIWGAGCSGYTSTSGSTGICTHDTRFGPFADTNTPCSWPASASINVLCACVPSTGSSNTDVGSAPSAASAVHADTLLAVLTVAIAVYV